MAYVITNGSSYIKIGNDNRPVTTKTPEAARVFDSKVKAQNVCVCLPSAYRNLGFYVVSTEPEKALDEGTEGKISYSICQKPDENTKLTEPAINLDEQYLDLNYVLDEINRFENFVRKFQAQAPAIHQQQLYAEAQIFDIEHAAELNKFNAYQGFKLYKKLHEARVLRRKCKDALSALSLLNEVVTEGLVDSKTSREIKHFSKRSFTPRALPELFQEGF